MLSTNVLSRFSLEDLRKITKNLNRGSQAAGRTPVPGCQCKAGVRITVEQCRPLIKENKNGRSIIW
jgi:hypothetical protein